MREIRTLRSSGGRRLPRDEEASSYQLALKKFLWQSVCHQQIRLKNHGLTPVEGTVDLHFGADYADVFEVRGQRRRRRGHDLNPELTRDQVVLGYRGLDDVIRRTVLTFSPDEVLLYVVDSGSRPPTIHVFDMAAGLLAGR